MNRYRRALWHALWNVEMVASPNSVKDVYLPELILKGNDALEWLTECTPTLNIDSLSFCRADLVNVLGGGSLMAEYLLASLNMSDASRRESVRLGALVSLIVASFDSVMDSGNGEDLSLFSRENLIKLMANSEADSSNSLNESRAISPVFALIGFYFARLKSLAGSRMASKTARSLLKVILAMYEAEVLTVSAPRPTPVKYWRRKSGLPYVVIGLTSQLIENSGSPADYRRHIHWVYNVGVLAGWCDDFCDIVGDRIQGHTNRLHDVLNDNSGGEVNGTLVKISDNVSRRARSLHNQALAGIHNYSTNATVIETLPCSLTVWLTQPDAFE